MKPPDACLYIRNKSYFLPPPADGFPEGEELATPCWCVRTQEPIGPDGKPVRAEDCRRGRGCYRPEVDL